MRLAKHFISITQQVLSIQQFRNVNVSHAVIGLPDVMPRDKLNSNRSAMAKSGMA